ncbi:MAG: M24 family metallopeptidase, partial [Armatimonadetes bacterium]|nr:M24 family metallopeptidase [Armatimonadota bacterium]
LPCREVDLMTRAFIDRHDLWEYWRHHTGHAIGMDYHEAPFLDHGDDRVIEPGMVFTVEPGIYVPGLGGFRHSDTVLATATGHEVLTYYPRGLANLTIAG